MDEVGNAITIGWSVVSGILLPKVIKTW